jgi:hypothetical protein
MENIGEISWQVKRILVIPGESRNFVGKNKKMALFLIQSVRIELFGTLYVLWWEN